MAETDKPRREAVAIRYDSNEDMAPKVVAKGAGLIADKILATAEKHTVPVYHNRTLTSMLMAVDLDREIPPAMYKAVAEVLAYVYRLDQKRRKR